MARLGRRTENRNLLRSPRRWLRRTASTQEAQPISTNPRCLLADAVLRIAAALEARGWPVQPTGAAATGHQEAAAHYDVERARELLKDAKAKAQQNATFEPLVKRATDVLEKAQRRLDSAIALRESSRGEPNRLGSQDEAWKRLCEASRSCALTARGIFLPAGGSTENADPNQRELPPAAFLDPGSAQACRLGNEVTAPWGRYIGVNFGVEEIDGIGHEDMQELGALPDRPMEKPTKHERKELRRMREAYDQLRAEGTIDNSMGPGAQHHAVLRRLGIGGKKYPWGYGPETFRTKIYKPD